MLKMYTRTIVAVPNVFFLFKISLAICVVSTIMKNDSMIDVMILSANIAIPPAYNIHSVLLHKQEHVLLFLLFFVPYQIKSLALYIKSLKFS